MRQADFEARHAESWRAFEAWLDARARGGRKPKAKAKRPARAQADAAPAEAQAPAPVLAPADMPQAFRQLCAHLALARDRQYSPELVDRLNALVLRGHHALYGARTRGLGGLRAFLDGGFARAVRAEWRCVLLATLLFFGPLLGLVAAIQAWPEFASVVLSPHTLGEVQEMYAPDNERMGMRDADTSMQMFGFYIWNNVRIGFQTFAGGVFLGLGSVFFLFYNGLHIGAVMGHLQQVGLGAQLWPFVAGHSAMELVAIVIAGAAGLKLGGALLAPGRRSRRHALVEAGRAAARLVAGAALMFGIAAAIEAFWSPLRLPEPLPKYLVGALMWLLVLSYLALSGRGRAA